MCAAASPGVALDAGHVAGRSAQAFDDVLNAARAEADSTRGYGNLFEDIVRAYLTHDALMRRQFARVYSWRDWPGRQGRPDTGIDLVAIEHEHMPANGEPDASTPATAIQCKAFAAGHTVQRRDIDSFLVASEPAIFTRRMYVETSDTAWGSNAEAAARDSAKPLTRIGRADLRQSNIDWTTFHPETRTAAPIATQARKTPRDHQVRAVNDVLAGFEANDRGTLVMACGTGKTFTALEIARHVVEDGQGRARIAFFVPSLALMSQTLHEWASEYAGVFTAWSVCSDIKVNRSRARADDIADIATVDLKVPPTTDPRKLAASWQGHRDTEGLQVVFATYQSIDVVHAAQELLPVGEGDFDLIICDEAHRTTGVTVAGEKESAFVRVHDDRYIAATKRLYMTATPRIFNDKVKNTASERDAVLTSMDDREIFGPLFHRLGFGDAVAAGLLTDYKVVVLAIPEEQMTEICQKASAAGGELSLPETAKLAGCWNALAKRHNGRFDVQYGSDTAPMRRAVAFAKDIRSSKQIAEAFPTIVRDYLRNLDNDDATDNLDVQCRHVDGTMNAIDRGEALDWLKEDPHAPDGPVCRILTNARCLSEGVDVPTLDAVLFLNPRKSQVDVIQAVGRVMRRAEGKEFGYIILPVAVPMGATPETALNDNKRFAVVWQVLQAIRAHDDRFDAAVNAIEYNSADPENIIVDVVNLPSPTPRDPFGGTAGDDDPTMPGTDVGQEDPPEQLQLTFAPSEWKDAVYSKIVRKVGTRLYWDDWSRDISEIATRYMALIRHLLAEEANRRPFEEFLGGLRSTLNPQIDEDAAIEMLAQHIITKPLFDAMFPDQTFTQQNPVSRAMQGILSRLATTQVFDNERAPLEKFYATMVDRITALDSLAGKQQIMRTLYDRFFSKAFPSMRDRLGIVFTPVEIVDYILRSADDALHRHFDKHLADEGVAIIEPFLGTGTFVARLLQLGLIPPDALARKYEREIFANEIVLLSYYIASINIEQVYREVRREAGLGEGYVEFPGISLTDTFQLHEDDGTIAEGGVFATNIERARRQKAAPIRVVVMNPPYSAGQNSANDNNQNLKYDRLDGRITETYAACSSGQNKNSLYDSYFRALRWATDRIGDEGVIAFVSNNAFIDGNTADGVRLTWQDEFADIYIYNLRGNARTQGETRRQEGGGVFGEGSRTGVAVTVLVKKSGASGPATIHYTEVDDYLTAQQKLDALVGSRSLARTRFEPITPNEHGDWINQRDEAYATYQPIGDKETKGKATTPGMFRQYTNGLKTNRDAWCYNFSREAVERNIATHVTYLNEERERVRALLGDNPTVAQIRGVLAYDSTRGSIATINVGDIRANRSTALSGHIQLAVYRPFVSQQVYVDQSGRLNERTYQLPQLYPTALTPNLALTVPTDYRREWAPLMTGALPDLTFTPACQCFPLYTWEQASGGGGGLAA
ncbi:DEAD/DEAH box helicase family protein [Nanchangia anserum]|uniref:restriction endonuclease n=1 Tax=Nanchangia anserum TaxID=2692125 RepID=UPI001CC562E1|nr:DEAD/DEAH box helicase family protein [Nanchangia anserum]